jgi:ComF family protein
MLKNLINLLFPKLCAGCNSLLLQNEVLICTNCRHDLPLTQHHLMNNNYIAKKFYGIIPIEFCSAMLYFHKDGIVQNLIHHLKYKNRPEIGTILGNWYANDIREIAKDQKFTTIIPVPLHKKRHKERGYNQVTTFCEALSQNLGIEINDQLLYRKMYSKTQTKKSKEARSEITNTLFDVSITSADHGKHYLLVDDVITSGATLEACARALLKIPDVKISILTIAYTDS